MVTVTWVLLYIVTLSGPRAAARIPRADGQTDHSPASLWSVGERLWQPNSGAVPSFTTMETSSSSRKPIKGILKHKSSSASSLEDGAQQARRSRILKLPRKKCQTWDEANILATRRHSHKNLTKMNEPGNPDVKVPRDGELSGSEVQGEAATGIWARKVATTVTFGPSCQVDEQGSGMGHTREFLLDKQERKRQFQLKRKIYCDEGRNIKLARKLMSDELQYEVDEVDAQLAALRLTS